eukprot:12020643-Alexandrium_andersonii.AAC.1
MHPSRLRHTRLGRFGARARAFQASKNKNKFARSGIGMLDSPRNTQLPSGESALGPNKAP